jgi:hypothetical protein
VDLLCRADSSLWRRVHPGLRLQGPVDSQQEKDTIATKAREIPGKDKVEDQLEVKAEKK